MDNKDLPAYPIVQTNWTPTDEQYLEVKDYGLTKLEAFTMAAMQGLAANPEMNFKNQEALSKLAITSAIATLNAINEHLKSSTT